MEKLLATVAMHVGSVLPEISLSGIGNFRGLKSHKSKKTYNKSPPNMKYCSDDTCTTNTNTIDCWKHTVGIKIFSTGPFNVLI